MKEGKEIKGKKSKIFPLLIAVIVILVLILGIGIYSGIKLKKSLEELNYMNNQLNIENQQLNSDFTSLHEEKDTLQKKYDLLYQDVQAIYKTCPIENACKGHFPGVSWYCNNVGDAVNDPSHICICDSSCALKATKI